MPAKGKWLKSLRYRTRSKWRIIFMKAVAEVDVECVEAQNAGSRSLSSLAIAFVHCCKWWQKE
jgi:hypothetical protein